MNFLFEFCQALKKTFDSNYFQPPTAEYFKRMEYAFRKAVLPGFIGGFRLHLWYWNNYLRTLKGIMIGKDGTPSLRMEEIFDLDLWIWYFELRLPSLVNDFNLHRIFQQPVFRRSVWIFN